MKSEEPVPNNGPLTIVVGKNFDEIVRDPTKDVLVKFYAPWCGHCKKMKPDWDKLAEEYAGSTNVLIADVDCTAAGEPLCERFGIEGFPTIKVFNPKALATW